jgi:hypothetical protein
MNTTAPEQAGNSDGKSAWRNKFRPTKSTVVGPNLFGLVQTEPLLISDVNGQ